MGNKHEIIGLRKYFIFDPNKSLRSQSVFAYRYIGKKMDHSTHHLLAYISPSTILFKLIPITLEDDDTKQLTYKAIDILKIPRTVNSHTSALVESTLIRLRSRRIVVNTFKGHFTSYILKEFIEDLYVYNNFNEGGEAELLKNHLEAIPILRGIAFSYLHTHWYKTFKGSKKKSVFRVRSEKKYEDAYVNVSKFMQNKRNEILFKKGGWFYNTKKNFLKKDFDARLFRIEKKFLKLSPKLQDTESFFTSPMNIRYILKRYGILDVLKLTLPKWLAFALPISLMCVIFFTLMDVLFFNILDEYNNHGWVATGRVGLVISSIAFSLTSFLSGLVLFTKYKLKVVPGIFLPRLIIAIISGWIIFLTTEELMKIDLVIEPFMLLLLFLFTISLSVFFMVFEVHTAAPAMSIRKVIARSFFVTGVAFIVSYTIGFWPMTYVHNKMMNINNNIVKNSTIINTDIDNFINDFENFTDDVQAKLKSNTLINIPRINDWNMFYKLSPEDTLKLHNGLEKSISCFVPFDALKPNYIVKPKYDTSLLNDTENNRILSIPFVKNMYDELMGSITKLIEQLNIEQKIYFEILVTPKQRDDLGNKQYQYEIKHLHVTLPKNQVDANFNNFNKLKDTILSRLKETPKYVLLKEYIRNEHYFIVNGHKIRTAHYPLKVPIYNEITEWITFPNLLLTRALLAMFIGIFLQLIIQDKTITEPI